MALTAIWPYKPPVDRLKAVVDVKLWTYVQSGSASVALGMYSSLKSTALDHGAEAKALPPRLSNYGPTSLDLKLFWFLRIIFTRGFDEQGSTSKDTVMNCQKVLKGICSVKPGEYSDTILLAMFPPIKRRYTERYIL